MLLHGGISLSDGACDLAREEQGQMQTVLTDLTRYLDEGLPVSDALARTQALPAYAVTMAELGHKTGQLEAVFASLGDFYEERQRTKHQLRSALFYPGVLLGVMVVVIGVLLIWVLPVFDQVYASLGSQLTGVAGALLILGQWLKAALPVLLALLLPAGVLAAVFARSPSLRSKVTGWWMARFGDRGISRKYLNARFLRGMEMGLTAGLLPEEAAENAVTLLQAVPGAAKRGADFLRQLRSGTSLPDSLLECGFLTDGQARLLRLGIRSGSSEAVMDQIARLAAEDGENALSRNLSRIEPAMVLTGSVLVGGILLSVMIPLVNILNLIG